MSATGETMIDRVVRVLAAFGGDGPLTASEIARRSGLPIPTAHRIITDLVRVGLLERDEARRFRVGVRLWELAARSASALTLREIALPYLEDLHAVVKEHTQLSILEGTDVLTVEKLTSRRSKSTNVTRPGARLPVLACASGLVLVAFSPPQTREQILETAGLTRFTEATVVDRAELRSMVTETRRDGFAVVRGWIHPGTTGVAVPILDTAGTAVAALSITISFGQSEEVVLPAMHTTARVISRAVSAGNEELDPRLNLLKHQIRRATGKG